MEKAAGKKAKGERACKNGARARSGEDDGNRGRLAGRGHVISRRFLGCIEPGFTALRWLTTPDRPLQK